MVITSKNQLHIFSNIFTLYNTKTLKKDQTKILIKNKSIYKQNIGKQIYTGITLIKASANPDENSSR